jgi:hypothetical protein
VKRRISVYLESSLFRPAGESFSAPETHQISCHRVRVRFVLSPDSADRLEAAFARRLDRLSRQSERLERNLAIAAETLALRPVLADHHAAVFRQC